jgi:predicted ATP-grasp superfamily ATP-dependent carboligase
MKKYKILIPDGEENLLYQVIFTLSKASDFEIHVLSKVKGKPMRFSRYIKRFLQISIETDTDLIENINSYTLDNQIDLILPIGEEGIKTVINNKHLISCPNKLVYLADKANYINAIDKSYLAAHCKKHDISHPNTIVLNPKNQFPNLDEVKFPVIIKPACGCDGQGIYVFKKVQDFNTFIQNKAKDTTYVLQEFIEGYDIDCSVLCKDGVVKVYTIQKGIMFENRKFSSPIGLQFLEDENLINTVRDFIKTLNWSGLAHIDLRYDSKTNTFKIIEINGRFWGSLDASCMAGVNFAELYIMDSLGNDQYEYNYKTLSYFNLKGSFKKVRQRPALLLNFSFIKNQTPLTYLIKDPLPIIFKYFERTLVLLKKRLSSSQ